MLTKVQKFINENSLFDKDDSLLLGLSGGRDSVVLLHVLLKLGYQVTVAHCNFNLRGEESDAETLFVQKLCEKWGVACHVKYFDVVKEKKEVNKSIQLIARYLRYNWFDSFIQSSDVNKIVTAHQLDDQVETFFINLSRGTGLKGLLGIPNKRDEVVRPLLPITREQVTSYAEENNLEFKDDSSNEKDVYLRNKIRQHVVPEFTSINPSFHDSFSKTISHLNQIEVFWKNSYRTWLNKLTGDTDVHFVVQETLKNGEEGFLTYYLNEIGFSYSDVQKVSSKYQEHRNGMLIFSRSHQLLFNRGEWILSVRTEEPAAAKYYLEETDVPISLFVKSRDYLRSMKIPVSKNVEWIDECKVQGKLFIKRWEQGDVFFPLGMSNKKKLSDFFIDNKFSRRDKEQIWLLCDEKSIIWIVGSRLDNRYKVTDRTKKILEIKVDL